MANVAACQALEELRVVLERDALARLQPSNRLKTARLEYIKAKMVCDLIDQLGTAEGGQVHKALQVARASQKLLLPPEPSELFAQGVMSSGAEVEAAVAGTSDHCLGVQPPKPPAQSSGQLLSSEVDTAMQLLSHQLSSMRDRWAVLLRLGTASSRQSRDNYGGHGPDTEDANASSQMSLQLIQRVADKRVALSSKQHQVQRQLLQLLRTLGQLLGLLNQMDREMLQFAERDILEHQAQLDQKNLGYDTAWVELMEVKLRAIELQVLSQTYTRTHVAALKRVEALVGELLGRLQQTLEQVNLNLNAYQALGPDFAALAAEYGSVRRQVAEAQRMLANFAAFEAELEEQDAF